MVDLTKTREAARIAVGALKMIPAFDTLTVTISITGIEIMALKKLALISHALADSLGRGVAGSLPATSAAQEQTVLATTLDELIRQIEIKGAGR